MATARVRSKTGCLTCKNRRKKCDETRPTCERCTRAGMECLGYAYLEEAGAKVRQPRAKLAARVSKPSPTVASSSRQSTTDPPPFGATSSFFPVPASSFDHPPKQANGALDPVASPWPLLSPHIQGDAPVSSIPADALDFSFLSDLSSTLPDNPGISPHDWWNANIAMSSAPAQQPSPSTNPPVYSPATRHSPAIISNPTEPYPQGPAPYRPLGASANMAASMTSGQASLLQALFSLEHSGPSLPLTASASQTPSSSHGSTWPSPDTEENDDSSATSDESDPEGVREIVCRTPTLDKNAPSNSLPFVLHSYSRWIQWTVFEPLRMANKARDYLTMRFNQSQDSRWAVTLVANIVRTLGRSSSTPTSYLPAISLLRDRTQRKLSLAGSHEASVTEPNSRGTLDALDDMFELISIQFVSSSLMSNMSLVRQAAPVYRRASPGPPDTPVNLPAILVHPEFSLRHFPAIDILFSLGLCQPTVLRYDVSYTPEFCAGVTDIDNVGLQWMHGIPDQFIMLLARMHMLRVDYAPNVDPQTIGEIEAEIKNFRPVLGVSTDPFLTVARLGVQESWRQALYVYLYMGLCGVDASDRRVEKALKGFIRLLEGTKPGRTPDVFLMVPMIVAGVASRRPQDRRTIQTRMLNLRECSQPGTSGHETVLTLNELWLRTDAEARPAVWMDLRIAVATISGIK
ncbi:hypothetical protein FRC12_000952 [Ceratobasidium sp. 428]|nr:hypothetical protein FRC12_000952 [Ceratobasidium sp. 428]